MCVLMFLIKNFPRTKDVRDDPPPPYILTTQTNLVNLISLWKRETSSPGIILENPWGFLAWDIQLPSNYPTG